MQDQGWRANVNVQACVLTQTGESLEGSHSQGNKWPAAFGASNSVLARCGTLRNRLVGWMSGLERSVGVCCVSGPGPCASGVPGSAVRSLGV